MRDISAGGGLGQLYQSYHTTDLTVWVRRQERLHYFTSSLHRFLKTILFVPGEREMEVMGITARERVLGDPDMLDIIFSYLDHRSVKRVRLVST